MNLKSKKDLLILCDGCMREMQRAELRSREGDVFQVLHCSMCARVYSAGLGYRDDATSAKADDPRPLAVKCERHDVALCIVGFADDKRMKLVCPIEEWDTAREMELSKIFLKGY
jgi:hypothetical protein